MDPERKTRPVPLLIAEAANPEWVSVPLIGWSLARALQQRTGAHIVTQVRNRDAILRAGLVEGRDFTAIDTEAVAAPAMRLAEALRMGRGRGWTMVTAISSLIYPHFERKVWRAFRDRINAGEFSVVHRITPLSPTATSPLAAKCRRAGVPFLAGPLNGGVPWPPGFGAEQRREREWLAHVRGAYRMMPGRRATLENAAALLVGSRHTESEIPERFRGKCVYMPENAIDPARFNLVSAQETEGPLRACFVGRLVPYKGADMVIEAAAPLLGAGRLTLDIVGDGPMADDLEAMVARTGTGAAVTFHGWRDHRAVQDIMARCNLLAFPSVREFGGGVVLEAMALGVVPVVVDYAGPGELVDGTTGFKLPLGSRAEITRALAGRLEAICADPSGLAARAARGRDMVGALFTWEARARQVAQVHDWLTTPGAAKPSFPFPG